MKVPDKNILAAVEKSLESTGGVGKAKENKLGGFLDVLKSSIDEANRLQMEADKASNLLASGEAVDIHNTMIAVQKADVSFRLMMEVRNKIVEAYHEIMRMQV